MGRTIQTVWCCGDVGGDFGGGDGGGVVMMMVVVVTVVVDIVVLVTVMRGEEPMGGRKEPPTARRRTVHVRAFQLRGRNGRRASFCPAFHLRSVCTMANGVMG